MNNIKRLFLKIFLGVIILLLTSSCNSKIEYTNWAMLNTGQEVCGLKGTAGIDIGADNMSLKWNSEQTSIALVDSPVCMESNNALNKIVYNGIHTEVDTYHSLSVAGIISTNSDSEYKSVLKDAPLYCIPVTVSDPNISFLINELENAEKKGIRVVNMSFTLDNFCQELYDYISNSQMLYVCAAGNDHSNIISYPANYDLDNVISVIGINNLGYCSSYSNFSSVADIAAPGENILCICENNSLDYLSGTSFAVPYVTASAAYLINRTSCNAEEAKKIIMDCATKLDTLCGFVSDGKMLSLKNILNYVNSYNKK